MEKVMQLLLICSLMTGLITEAVKKSLPEKATYSKTLLAGIISIIVAVGVSIGYIILARVPVTQETVVYIIELIVMSWLCSTLGYDTVKKTVLQITGNADEK